MCGGVVPSLEKQENVAIKEISSRIMKIELTLAVQWNAVVIAICSGRLLCGLSCSNI